MKRRSLLGLAAASLTSAGFLGASESVPFSHSDSASEGRPGAAVSDADASLSSAGAETFEYVIRLNDLGDDPRGQVTPVVELDGREREVAEAALAGEYATRDPPEWLVRFASATPFVERDGAYYRLEDTFPTYHISAETAEESDIDGEIASYEEYERAVTREKYAMTRLLGAARRETVELSYCWPALREFLAAYDAVRYRGDLLSVELEVADSGPPYTVSAVRVPVSEVVGGSVWNAAEAPERTRRLVREAGAARGAYGFDRAPADLLDRLRANEYVRLGGTFYAAAVEKRGAIPVSVSAEVRDGRLRLSVTNESDRELALSSGPPRPFGVLRCRPTDDSETRHLLWTDAYADSNHVQTAGRNVRQVTDVALVSKLAPGEAVSETYAVGDLPSGEYAVADSLGAKIGEESPTVRYRVTFSVA